MKLNLSKKEIEEKIKEIFSKKEIPTPKEIKKAKVLAMSKNINLGSLRKKFCKKCLTCFTENNSETRIKKPFKIVKCKNCGYLNRFNLSSSQ